MVVGQRDGLRQLQSALAQHREERFGPGDRRRWPPADGRAAPPVRSACRRPRSAWSARRRAPRSRRCPPARRLRSTRSTGRGQGSRSGPAGSSQPLPMPRSSNTQISMSRCRRVVLQAVVADDDLGGRVGGQQRLGGFQRGAAPRTPARRAARAISSGSSPTSRGAAVARALRGNPAVLRPWPRDTTPAPGRASAGARPAPSRPASCRRRPRPRCRPRPPARRRAPLRSRPMR